MGVLSELKTKDYFTLTGTFFGFCALITGTMTDAFRGAFIFVFLSVVFDLLDGMVARKMNQVKENLTIGLLSFPPMEQLNGKTR